MPNAIIYCAVLEDEILALNKVPASHLFPLEQGLHNTPPLLRERLQQTIDLIESTLHPEQIILAYGLCSRGTEAIAARHARLIIPRAHDCITLLLGAKERYAQYVAQHPGTYWYSPGWNRHHVPPGKDRYDRLLAEYRAKFSAEDAEFLMETEQAWFNNYNLATYVDIGVTPIEHDLAYTQECATWLKWSFDHVRGDPQLLQDLLDGPWDDARFLVLQPGESLKMTADDQIITRTTLTIEGRPPA